MVKGTFLLGKINRGIVNVTSFFTLPSIGASKGLDLVGICMPPLIFLN